jgi:hypothetical protein
MFIADSCKLMERDAPKPLRTQHNILYLAAMLSPKSKDLRFSFMGWRYLVFFTVAR